MLHVSEMYLEHNVRRIPPGMIVLFSRLVFETILMMSSCSILDVWENVTTAHVSPVSQMRELLVACVVLQSK